MQFGRILELPPNMRCLGVKEDILMDSQPSIRLLHQIDFPCWLSPSEFSVAENYDEDDTRCEYEIVVPRYEIPKWFNHQSVESSISFWIGLEFPTFALCLVFCLDQLTDKDTYSCVCVVHISINGHKRLLIQRLFQDFQYDHLWFYGAPQSLLQQKFGDLIQSDRNHVEISSKISHWTSKTGGKIAPIIERLGVHVECICNPKSTVIIPENGENVDDDFDNTVLSPSLPLFPTSNDSNIHHGGFKSVEVLRLSTDTSNNGFDSSLMGIHNDGSDLCVSAVASSFPRIGYNDSKVMDGDGLDLGSSSVVHPYVNSDSGFNPDPP